MANHKFKYLKISISIGLVFVNRLMSLRFNQIPECYIQVLRCVILIIIIFFIHFQELLQGVIDNAPRAALKDLEQIVSFGCAILSPESSYPDFPVDSLNNIARIINNNPNIPIHNAIYRLYPYKTFLSNDGIQGIYTLLQTLNIPIPAEEGVSHQIIDIQPSVESNKCVGG